MRILFMTDGQPNPDSGAAGTEFQTAAALRRIGHDVDEVWADALPRRIAHGNMHYLFELPLTMRAAMKQRLRDTSYDVVHASQPHAWLAARSLGNMPRRPVFVHRSHGFEGRVHVQLKRWKDLAPSRPPARRALSAVMETALHLNNHLIVRHADGHLLSSSLCRDFLIERYGVPAARIAVIPQAPPAAYMQAPPSPMTVNRLDRLLHVGQFAFFKAPMVLAEAVDLVLRDNPRATMTWVCDARHHETARALFAPATRERVQFLSWMTQRELMNVYDAHGVFLFPSFFEGFGKVFLEAMSRGLLVVASGEGGTGDVITHRRDGYLVPVGDAAAMASACLSIQSDLDQAAATSRAAHEAASRYSWDRTARESADFYSRLVEGV